MTVLTVGLLVQRVQGPWLEPLMVRSRFLAKRLKTNLPDTAICLFSGDPVLPKPQRDLLAR